MPYTWLATGSYGRFEPFPSSDVETALAWEGPDDDDELGAWMRTLAERVLEWLTAAGFRPDEHGAVASSPLFARSIEGWEAAARSWVEHPDRDRGLILLSVVVESDPVWGTTGVSARLAGAFARSPNRDEMLRRLAAAALLERPPTGFRRHRVLFWGGERKMLDIKRAGLLPIESLARWAGLAAGVSAASTPSAPGGRRSGGHARARRRGDPARRLRAGLRAAHGAPGGAAPRRPPAGRPRRAAEPRPR